MNFPNTRFHSDDWVYVRYVRPTKQGRLVAPIEIQADDGETVRGYQCNAWIDQHPDARGTVRCLDLTNAEVTLALSEIDRERPIEAYAYTSEKVFYLRSNLVENFPDTAEAILRANLENVPRPTPDFIRDNEATIAAIVTDLRASQNPRVRA